MSAVARRRALAAAIAAGVAAVVVALLVTGGSGSSRPIADGAARLVPGDALVWVHVSTDGDRDAVRRAEAVAARFPSYARLRGSVLSRLSVGGAGLGRWLGREAGLALLDSPSGTAASLVVLSVRDRGAARRFLGTGAPAETYRGVRLLRYGTVEAGLVGSYVVVGRSDALHRAVDLAQGRGDPLATSGAYRRAMAGLPADRVADAFVTAAGVRRLLDPAGGLLGAMGTLLDRPGLQAAGLSLSADAPGARLVVHKLSSPGGASAFPPFAPALAGEVPSGVLAYPTYPIDVDSVDERLGHCWKLRESNGLELTPVDIGSVTVVTWDRRSRDFGPGLSHAAASRLYLDGVCFTFMFKDFGSHAVSKPGGGLLLTARLKSRALPNTFKR